MTTNKLLTPIMLASFLATQPVMAESSGQHFSNSIGHSGAAVGHSLIGSAKLVSGVVAIPFLLTGAVGQVSGEVGEELWDVANEPAGTPLKISDEIFTIGPSPSHALQQVEE